MLGNATSAISGGVTLGTGFLVFFFIAHGTGLVSEFIADVTFRIQGKPEKMGSFNMTRDWFYKPLGESIAENINSYVSNFKIDNNIGIEMYNCANLAFTLMSLESSLKTIVRKLRGYEGAGIYYEVKYKNVAVSTWGRQSMSYRKYGSTTLKALIGDLTNIIPDTYTTKKAIETEMEKR